MSRVQIPQKRLLLREDLEKFNSSETRTLLVEFIDDLTLSVQDKPNSADIETSDVSKKNSLGVLIFLFNFFFR